MRQPKKPKVSPAKAAANAKFAAAGRAAQARKRAAYAAQHHGAKLPPSKAQRQAQLKFAAAGRAAQAARKAGKVYQKAAAVMPAEYIPGGSWVSGCNDVAPTCATVAVMNHLLAATGVRATDEDVLRIHRQAGGEGAARICDVLELLHARWLTIGRTNVRLMRFIPTDEQVIVAGLVVGVRLPHDRHAVVSCAGGVITWGQVLPWTFGEPDEAWALEWAL